MKISTLFILLLNVSYLFSQIQIGPDILGSEEGEEWGTSIRLSADGEIMAIGGPYSGEDQGSLQIFQKSDEQFEFLWGIRGVKLGSSGLAVDVSDDGNTVIVGSPSIKKGQFNIFSRNGDKYEAPAFPLTGPEEDSWFGSSLALSGDGKRVAVGATQYDGNGENLGYIVVLELNDGQWDIVGEPMAGKEDGAGMGWAVDLSHDGTVMAVSSIHNFSDNPKNSLVEVFAIDEDEWVPKGMSIKENMSRFGHSIALSSDGERIAITGSAENFTAVYEFDGDEWQKLGNEFTSNLEGNLGYKVDISGDGNRVVISNSGATEGPAIVKIFDYYDGIWQENGELNSEGGEYFGSEIDLSTDGNTLAIGVPKSDVRGQDLGRVEIYALDAVMTSVVPLEATDISVYPNPTSGQVFIEGNEVDRQRPILIYDLLGRTVDSKSGLQSSLDLSSFPPGIYQILIPTSGQNHVVQKVVKR